MYGNYAPFYRPNYYPMQADNTNQFGQPYQAPIQPPTPLPTQTQPTNDMLWVLNENEATSFPVAANNTVILWDKNLPTIYIKSVNASGVPSMRILDFKERVQTIPTAEHECNCGKNFVSIDLFNALDQQVKSLSKKIEGLTINKTDGEENE